MANKKRKMDIEEEPKVEVVDVNVLVNNWLKAQSEICTILLNIVNKINELEKKI